MSKMTFPVFLELVEIKTKLASLFPFLIGLLFSIHYFHTVNWVNTIVFFVGMLFFDMTTTAINNYMDYKKAKSEAYKYEQNIVGKAGLNEKTVTILIVGMLFIAACVGGFLTYRTGWMLFIMGGICCFIGVFYTFGPVPLSRMPLGEVFSGVTMGFGIFLLTVYINTFQLNYLTLDFFASQFVLQGNLRILFMLLWVSLPMVFTIANIMLANNLCDLDQDIENHRYTLPFYIGRQNGIHLFQFLMYSCYLLVTVSVLLKFYSWTMLIVWGTLPIIRNNVQIFSKKQIKSETFSISIKNLVLFNSAQIVGLLAGMFF